MGLLVLSLLNRIAARLLAESRNSGIGRIDVSISRA